MLRTLRDGIADLDRFQPDPLGDPDWSPLQAIVDELAARPGNLVEAVDPLLRALDRFGHRDGFSPWWSMVQLIERIPGYELAIVASYQLAPTPIGVTLLLRVIGRGATVIDGVDLAAFTHAALAEDLEESSGGGDT